MRTVLLSLPFAVRPRRGPVPLSAVLEPVADLCEGQSGDFGQVFLLVRSGIPVVLIALLEGISGLLFEAVNGLLSVPDSLGQGELFPQPVLVHCAQAAAPGPLRLLVAGFQVEVLQEPMVRRVEDVALQNGVQLFEFLPVESHQRLGLQQGLVAT